MTGMLKSVVPNMTGMLKTVAPAPLPTPSIDAFDAHRRAALDAQLAHQRIANDRKRLEAQLGPQGYAQALATAAKQAEQASAAYQAVWGFGT